MVRLRRPERLLKMITRYIDKKHGVTHTSIVMFDSLRGHYTFFDSKGSRRIPPSLIKFETDHPLIKWFWNARQWKLKGKDFLPRTFLERTLKGNSRKIAEPVKKEMEAALRMMDSLKVELVIPGYFKKNLFGILLLGKKRSQKPFSRSEINFFQILAQDCSMALKSSEYHQGLLEKNQELEQRLAEIERLRKKEQQTYYEIMKSLVQEVYAKDAYTFDHIHEVERLGVLTGEKMGLDLSPKKKAVLSAGLILHDVGKIGVPDHILNKPEALTREEWQMMRTHVDKGVRILEPLTDFNEVKEIVRCHHENFDGSGYPRGLKGDQIPIESRIIAVVDAFHTIVTNRCYHQGRSVEEAFKELRRCSGTQFDPRVVEAFIQIMQEDERAQEVLAASLRMPRKESE